MKNQSTKTIKLVQLALFAALIIIMASTPMLGYIPLGFTRATIIHIPVILGAIVLGPKYGAILGGIFGCTSFLNNTFNPTITSFVFTPFYTLGDFEGGIGSIIICFVPRILVGVIPYFVYQGMQKAAKNRKGSQVLSLGVAGVSGALTNTLLVMGMILLFFRESYALANNISVNAVFGFVLTIIGMNGVPEAIVAAVLVALIGKILISGRFLKS
ncbi:MAG: ECF transporter S component [Faecalimonas sp.]|nr:ECF transporter S component [Faecalimonas sp.]